LSQGIDGVSLEFSHCLGYSEGLQAVLDGGHDIAFVDYFLGPDRGSELIAAAGGRLCPTPLVLLAGQTGSNAEREAIQAGAVDFVDKMTLSPEILRRVIRYARYNHNTARQLALSQERYGISPRPRLRRIPRNPDSSPK
jgi:FixJ family two-component response regulator